MESELPKNFLKFHIFKNLIKDISFLIKNLENELKNKLNKNFSNNPSNNSSKEDISKSALGSQIKKIWPFKGFSEAQRPSLSDYLENKNRINNFLDEIIIKNTGKLTLIEQYDQISDIIDKFKLDAFNIFSKYSKMLQPEYDKERENFIKSTKIPDPVSDQEVEKAYDSKVNFEDFKDENKIEELKKILVSNDTNVYNKEEVKEELGDSFSEELYKKILTDINEIIINYSPKIIKGGKEKWQEIVSKNKKEFFDKWIQAKNEDLQKMLNYLTNKKSKDMAEFEKLLFTLFAYFDTPEYDEFINPYL